MGGGQGHGTTYKGVTIHQPKRWHTITGKGLCAVLGILQGKARWSCCIGLETSLGGHELQEQEEQNLKCLLLWMCCSNVYFDQFNKFGCKIRDFFLHDFMSIRYVCAPYLLTGMKVMLCLVGLLSISSLFSEIYGS
ncbi:NADH dehydrogenase [ubiquinone] 1 beta subcomplex subunit 2 [Glycine soja]